MRRLVSPVSPRKMAGETHAEAIKTNNHRLLAALSHLSHLSHPKNDVYEIFTARGEATTAMATAEKKPSRESLILGETGEQVRQMNKSLVLQRVRPSALVSPVNATGETGETTGETGGRRTEPTGLVLRCDKKVLRWQAATCAKSCTSTNSS